MYNRMRVLDYDTKVLFSFFFLFGKIYLTCSTWSNQLATCSNLAPLLAKPFQETFRIEYESHYHFTITEQLKKKNELYRWPCLESENRVMRPISTARDAPTPATTNVGSPAQQRTTFRARPPNQRERWSEARCSEAYLSFLSPDLPAPPQWPNHWTRSSTRRNHRRGRGLARRVKHTRAEAQVSGTWVCWIVRTIGRGIRGLRGGGRRQCGGRKTALEVWWTSSFGRRFGSGQWSECPRGVQMELQ